MMFPMTEQPPGHADRARDEFPYRMKDLCERTGLPRQVVHFYIQQGLLPEGHKTGRNMAYYNDKHVERILLVRKLQHERFLPLKAIRALLEQRDEAFSPVQRRLLGEVKERLRGPLAPPVPGALDVVPVAPLLEAHGLDDEDLAGLLDCGLLALGEANGLVVVARDDSWIFEIWGELRAAGFSRELGFTARDLLVFDEAISAMFAKEAQLLGERVSHLPPEEVAPMVERALPIIHTLLARLHTQKTKNFFAAL